MKSYFFIPADKPKFLAKIANLKASEFVIDFEDAVHGTDDQKLLDNLDSLIRPESHYLRLPYDRLRDQVYMKSILDRKCRKFVIPKFETVKKLEQDLGLILQAALRKELQLVLLVENPTALLDLANLEKSAILSYTKGIGLGSHDYSSNMRMEHTDSNLAYARMHILNFARVYGIEAIDTASMNISDEESFQKEIANSFGRGFDGKFVIHPNQLTAINDYPYYSDEEVTFAYEIMQQVEKVGYENFGILRLADRVIEKPHIRNYEQIIEWHERKK